jgi:hypothetical protein
VVNTRWDRSVRSQREMSVPEKHPDDGAWHGETNKHRQSNENTECPQLHGNIGGHKSGNNNPGFGINPLKHGGPPHGGGLATLRAGLGNSRPIDAPRHIEDVGKSDILHHLIHVG